METGKFTASTKHIVLIVPGFPKDENDTRCLPAVHLFALELAKNVERVSIFALHYPFSTRLYTWNGIDVYPLNGANKIWKRHLTLFASLRRSMEYVNRQHPIDILHAMWLNEGSFYGLRLAHKWNLPLVMTAHGQDVFPSNRYLKSVIQSEKDIYCLSEFQKVFLKKAGCKNPKVIEWGTQAVEIEPARTIDLLAVGNLIPLKNTGYLLDLCAALKAKGKVFKALLIGEGPELTSLRAKIVELHLEDTVELRGACSHEEALKTISSAKVLVHASAYEGFGMVLIEALAAGTHVLSTPVGIAFENKKIHSLSMKVEEDVKTLNSLLETEQSAPFLYPIQTTVERYLKVYAGV